MPATKIQLKKSEISGGNKAVKVTLSDVSLDDTKQYVSFPMIIFNGKGELKVKKYNGNYTLYYQFVETMDGSGKATNTVNPVETPRTAEKDTTTAKTVLPNTGKVIIAWIIVIVAVSGVVAHIKYKKLYM